MPMGSPLESSSLTFSPLKPKPRLVILDAHTLNPGDLSWDGFEQYFDLRIFPRSQAQQVLERCQDAEFMLTNKVEITASLMDQLPQLRYIGVLATGTNVVDVAYAAEQGIAVTNVPAYGPDAVAQMVFAHILHHTQRLALHDTAVKAGEWSNAKDFCFSLAPLISLKGKHLGLIGFGDIARRVSKVALAFEMKVTTHTRNPAMALPEGVEHQALADLLSQGDIISLHCPLTSSTHELINQDSLRLIKPQALLINTARGGLINEQALSDALNRGDLYAGLDVLSQEPPDKDNPLLSANNVSISPHIAWATLEARQKLLQIALANLMAFLRHERVNRVSP